VIVVQVGWRFKSLGKTDTVASAGLEGRDAVPLFFSLRYRWLARIFKVTMLG